jgi:hypothetical protein
MFSDSHVVISLLEIHFPQKEEPEVDASPLRESDSSSTPALGIAGYFLYHLLLLFFPATCLVLFPLLSIPNPSVSLGSEDDGFSEEDDSARGEGEGESDSNEHEGDSGEHEDVEGEDEGEEEEEESEEDEGDEDAGDEYADRESDRDRRKRERKKKARYPYIHSLFQLDPSVLKETLATSIHMLAQSDPGVTSATINSRYSKSGEGLEVGDTVTILRKHPNFSHWDIEFGRTVIKVDRNNVSCVSGLPEIAQTSRSLFWFLLHHLDLTLTASKRSSHPFLNLIHCEDERVLSLLLSLASSASDALFRTQLDDPELSEDELRMERIGYARCLLTSLRLIRHHLTSFSLSSVDQKFFEDFLLWIFSFQERCFQCEALFHVTRPISFEIRLLLMKFGSWRPVTVVTAFHEMTSLHLGRSAGWITFSLVLTLLAKLGKQTALRPGVFVGKKVDMTFGKKLSLSESIDLRLRFLDILEDAMCQSDQLSEASKQQHTFEFLDKFWDSVNIYALENLSFSEYVFRIWQNMLFLGFQDLFLEQPFVRSLNIVTSARSLSRAIQTLRSQKGDAFRSVNSVMPVRMIEEICGTYCGVLDTHLSMLVTPEDMKKYILPILESQDAADVAHLAYERGCRGVFEAIFSTRAAVRCFYAYRSKISILDLDVDLRIVFGDNMVCRTDSDLDRDDCFACALVTLLNKKGVLIGYASEILLPDHPIGKILRGILMVLIVHLGMKESTQRWMDSATTVPETFSHELFFLDLLNTLSGILATRRASEDVS